MEYEKGECLTIGPNGIIKGSYDPKTLTAEQRIWLYQQFGHSGDPGAGYGGEHVAGDYGQNYQNLGNGQWGLTQGQIQQAQQAEADAKAKKAQDEYSAAIGTAVSGLQTQKSNLSDQYSSLLATVKGQYDPLINQTTASAGAELSRRGLTPDSALFQKETQGALQPIYGAQAANAQAIGQGSINDVNAITQAIAALQAGAAGTSSQLPLDYGQLGLQYGNLALGQQSLAQQLAIAQLQANTSKDVARIAQQYQQVPAGNFLVNTTGRTYLNPSALMQALGYAAGGF